MTAMTTSSIQHTIGAEGLFVLHLGSGDVRLHGADGDAARVEDRHGNPIVDDFEVETGDGSLAVRARKGLGPLDSTGAGRRGAAEKQRGGHCGPCHVWR